MKVYLVTSGSYSDYHVDAVFMTREKAEEYVDRMGRYAFYDDDYCGIDEREVDMEIPLVPMVYTVTGEIDYENPDFEFDISIYADNGDKERPIEFSWLDEDHYYVRVEGTVKPRDIHEDFADIQSRIRKIVQDKFYQWKYVQKTYVHNDN